MSESLVWYACYGSNLDRERFMCYIAGGKPPGRMWSERGCRDKTPPREDRLGRLPYALYFAGYAMTWAGAPAFIDAVAGGVDSLARQYLISEEQFIDVLRQENPRAPEDLDLTQLREAGRIELGAGAYDLALCPGEEDGRPVFTFTASTPLSEREPAKPAVAYLQTIMRGLRQISNRGAGEISEYLSACPGVAAHYDQNDLEEIYASAGEPG
jgi:hypothetical protein